MAADPPSGFRPVVLERILRPEMTETALRLIVVDSQHAFDFAADAGVVARPGLDIDPTSKRETRGCTREILEKHHDEPPAAGLREITLEVRIRRLVASADHELQPGERDLGITVGAEVESRAQFREFRV